MPISQTSIFPFYSNFYSLIISRGPVWGHAPPEFFRMFGSSEIISSAFLEGSSTDSTICCLRDARFPCVAPGAIYWCDLSDLLLHHLCRGPCVRRISVVDLVFNKRQSQMSSIMRRCFELCNVQSTKQVYV